MNFRALLASLGIALALCAQAPAENLPADHPANGLVKQYLDNVAKQDWKAVSSMLQPTFLERRRLSLINNVKNSETMSVEAAKLAMLGVKDIKELEKMTPQDAFIADREAVHKRMKVSPEDLKKKQETLKINVLGLVPEESGKIVHALVRTSQDTTKVKIDELLLVSLVQDKEDAKKWFIVPDMQQPIATEIGTAKPAPAP
jgi:predicted nucleotidyltransferase